MPIYLEKDQIETFANDIINNINDNIFNNVFNYLQKNPSHRKFINPAFPYPHTVRIGILKNYFAVEYLGPEDESTNCFETEVVYNQGYDLYNFIGMEFDHSKTPKLPVTDSLENMNFFLGNSISYLCDYFYDFMQIREDFMLNGCFDLDGINQPIVINNCTFFYSDNSGGLKIKHIDMLEIFPLQADGIAYHTVESLHHFAKYIISKQFPQYDIKLHKILNEFIELINIPSTDEPDITKFIEKNPELLQLAFGFNKLNPQIDLIWQDRDNRNDLKPDFLPQDMSGYCDILDFKLPNIKSKPIVGIENRKHPSFEIDTCVSQLDAYEEFCSQHLNQVWLEKTHNIKIDNPQRFIVMGHSKDFTPKQRQQIRKLRKTSFFTYDEFIEMARFQIYRIK